jgi:hypothetical protein
MLYTASWLLGMLLAQGQVDLFQKAPPEVDEALRARVTKFYQAHVDGKYRRADEVVAEDSKDAFFEARKPHYRKFELSRILYSDEFRKAKVTVICGTDMLIPLGGMRIPANVPITTTWKLVDGQWFWYIEPDTGRETPWGTMKPGPEPAAGASAMPPPPLPKGNELGALSGMVRVDKSEVRLPADTPGDAEVQVSHRMPGTVSLAMETPTVPGLEVKLDRRELKPGETARLSIHYAPPGKGPKPPAIIRLLIDPLSEVISIRLNFTGGAPN